MSDQPQPQNRHEHRDVAPRWPVFVGAGMLLLLPVSIAIVSALMSTVWMATPPSLDPFGDEPRVIDGPKLQENPPADMAELSSAWHERLTHYGWVDRERGIVHIPIEQAMQRLAEEGLSGPTRPPGPVRVRPQEPGAR